MGLLGEWWNLDSVSFGGVKHQFIHLGGMLGPVILRGNFNGISLRDMSLLHWLH